jgi:DNA-binding NtrC family response regulator
MDVKPKVLIVDDEERYRTTLVRLLRKKGVEAASVGSGREAVEAVGKESYDVIILDVKMPEMDGIATLAEIKKVDPRVECLILSGHASVECAIDVCRLGGCEYLLKPVDIDDLILKIDAAYERKTMTEEAG